MDEPDAQPNHPRPKVTNACEACRAAKVKCQASNQLGICRRCLDSKRECIFKTGPRTRRPRQSKLADPAQPRPPPPAGPSKTFTIDIPMAMEEDPLDSLEDLCSQHEVFIRKLVPEMPSDVEDEEWFDAPDTSTTAPSVAGSGISGSSLPVGASATQTPPSSVASRPLGKRTLASTLGLQPQFNVESATALLETFQGLMLQTFPCIVLPDDATVSSLAKERPFVLLAIMAVASSSISLQGHSLYDEDFRKVLGLKFVAGGERSLELLQGVVIYVAWYPFHLRVKNRQAIQYVRMAGDILCDLELDQDQDGDGSVGAPTERRLEEIRIFLAAYHIVCTFATAFNRSPTLKYTPYINKCCDILATQGKGKGDVIMAWQVRVQRIIEQSNTLRRTIITGDAAQAYQHTLLLKGMEAELNEWERTMPPEIKSSSCIRIHFLMARIFLTASPLLKLPAAKKAASQPAMAAVVLTEDLRSKIPVLRELYELYIQQPRNVLNAFSCICWSYLVVSIVVGFRMSFSIPSYEGWDDVGVRQELDFGTYLDRMCRIGEQDPENPLASISNRTNLDIVGASKIVIKVMAEKYRKRVAKLDRAQMLARQAAEAMGNGSSGLDFLTPELMQLDKSVAGCPMMDGSMDAYYPLWDETFTDPGLGGKTAAGGGAVPIGVAQGGEVGGVVDFNIGPIATSTAEPPQASYTDLWATMTMGWSQNDIDFNNI